MFGSRRRRAASNPPNNGNTVSTAANIAATSAFLKNRSSNASLSSAAAAAALKARPMSPTSVADVQTKRTLRRAGSTSSVGSSINGSQRSATPQLERRLSSGSMTERTFRDPSPGRPVPSAVDAPPVPAIPQNIQTVSHRRAASTDAPPVRIASPVSRYPAGRGSSLGPQGTAVAAMKAGQRASISSASELTSPEQRRGSVNFSYPTNSRPNSPTQKRLTTLSPARHNPARITTANNQSLVYDPNTRSFLPVVEDPANNQNLVYDPNSRSFRPTVEAHAIQQQVNNAAEAPVRKKKKAPAVNGTGSHLSDKTVGGRPKGTAVDALKAQMQHSEPSEQAQVKQTAPDLEEPIIKGPPRPFGNQTTKPIAEPVLPPQTTAPAPKKKKKRVVVSESDGEEASPSVNTSDNDSDNAYNSPRSFPLLGKKPSIVREDREREELEDDTPQREQPSFLHSNARSVDRNISPTPLPRSKAGRNHVKDLTVVEPVAEPIVKSIPEPQESVIPPPAFEEVAEPVAEATPLNKNGSIRGARVSSLSPGRTAHFAPSPDNLTVKHQPPPRSISPRKSALKHSNSRNTSPMPNQGSETSNSPGTDDQALPRKKSVRVSFDETNVVVGEAAAIVTTDSPIAASPQISKRPWYSIGRGKKKESIVTDSEEDEVMKPRPALPSFGSIRERKYREVEERPLVKPAEPTGSKVGAKPPVLPSPINEVNEDPLGQSLDHAVGAVLVQDSQTRNAANISKSREPLPPQVTSVEGSGYSSDSDTSISGVESQPSSTTIEPEETKVPGVNEGAKIATVEEALPLKEEVSPIKGSQQASDSDDAPTPTQETTNGIIPKIAISQPTPTPGESERKEWLGVPGSWESTSDSENEDARQVDVKTPEAPTPAIAGIAEPTPDLQIYASPKIEAEKLYTATIAEETEESEADVFSDAAEELTDSDQEGFQSLNAAVESPITTAASLIPNPPDSPTTKIARERALSKSDLPKQGVESTSGDWDTAQQYWRSLSAEKKRQMELEAIRDPESSDTEVEKKPAPKPKKKKKVVQADPPQPVVVAQERSYMIQPGSKAAPGSYAPTRTSMRTEAPSLNVETGMRKSMRGPAQGSMRDSMRGSSQKKARPTSLPVEPRINPTVNKHSRNLSAASAAAASNLAKAPPPKPVLRRKNSSDSESSFKRTRPSGDRSMLRTMRRNSSEQQQSSRFSVRSMSPTGSVTRSPFSSIPSQPARAQTSMRMSMRGSADPTPTMRGPAGRAKSPSGGSLKLGFGFSSSKGSKPQKSGRSLGSRFADSSDEDESRPTFRSRFVDSSDESGDDVAPPRAGALGRTLRSPPPSAPAQVATPPTALRGIPKRAGADDGDSSDLPDSDDEKPTSPGYAKLSKKRQTNGAPVLNGVSQGTTLASSSLRRSGSGRGTITTVTASPQARPPHKRRGSIMSILRRKKDDNSKVRKSDAESPARRDTPLERSRTDLLAIKNDQQVHSPKLQKRNPLSRENSFVPNSPASPVVNNQTSPVAGTPKNLNGEEKRPFTADGNGAFVGAAEIKEIDGVNGAGAGAGAVSAKPGLGNRRFTSDAIGSVGFESPTKKKKKFGSLRRIFGLHD